MSVQSKTASATIEVPPLAGGQGKPVIAVRDLTVNFGGRTILDHINLDVYRGQTLAMIGLSGVGKSTLIRCVIGLQKPNSGSIFINGKQAVGLPRKQLYELRRIMGMVFQSPALFDSLTIGENVAFGLREHGGMDEGEIQSKVAEMLAIVDLAGMEVFMPSQLSGGMQKRASLARALALGPEIVLYDEPTTGLDPIICNSINNLILRLKETFKVTSILITHDMNSAYTIADRIAMIYQGRIVGQGTAQEIKNTDHPIIRQFVEGRLEGPIKV